MAEEIDVYKLIIEVEGAQTIGQLEDGLKKLKNELKKTDLTTTAFDDIQKAISDTEEQLGTMGQTVRQSGDKINMAFAKASTGIISGFQAAAGAMAVFTNGSEESIKAIAKLQALLK